MINAIDNVVNAISGVLYKPYIVPLLLVLAGIVFTARTGLMQFRLFGESIRVVKEKPVNLGATSSFGALMVSTASRVGTGNIMGVSTALCLGGPGAIFWMWITAILGGASAFVESTLAQIYKFPHRTGYRGGPFSFIEHGLGKRWLGIVFAVITILACGIFLPTVQSNGVSSAVKNAFPVSPLVSGIVLAAILGLVIMGGVKRIAKVATVVTPFMALGYIVMSLVVVGYHIQDVPAVFGMIFRNAFGINPLCGGIIGSTIAMGVKRGIFSNEAGQGTGAIVSAATDVPHPAQQGLAQAFSVYVDTLLVCTATALMILSSGTFNILGSDGQLLYAGAPELANNYVGYTQSAVDSVFTGFGSEFVSIAMVFFVFTTIMAYYFYAETSIIYLFQGREGKREKLTIRIFQVLMLGAVIFGAVKEADLIWQLGDIGVGLMAWFTVIAILILCPKAIQALREYEASNKKA